MSKEKLTPVEWLLNELDQRDMIDKTIYNKKYRTFEVIKKKALKMEQDRIERAAMTAYKCA